MSGFNYSKWDNIELSDDESDLHPNIDKDSWFRMKHRTRVEREENEDKEVKEIAIKNSQDAARLKIIDARLRGIRSGEQDEDAEFEDVDALQVEKEELEQNMAARNSRVAEIQERRKWNIDNICKVVDEKTVVNKKNAASLHADVTKVDPTKLKEYEDEEEDAAGGKETSAGSDSSGVISDLKSTSSTNATTATTTAVNGSAGGTAASGNTTSATKKAAAVAAGKSKGAEPAASIQRERLSVISYNDYCIDHEQLLETYSEIADLETTKEFLFKNCDVLLHEHAQSYMLLSCLEDEMNGKHKRMKLVCRQSQILSHINDLGQSMGRDPRDVILPFFQRIGEGDYLKGFLSAVEDFIKRIEKRAVEKRKEMDAERLAQRRAQQNSSGSGGTLYEGEDEPHPLGPGGLDPFEVLKTLPDALREAFESQDIERLQEVLAHMEPQEAKSCMKRCVDSGLWVAKDPTVFEKEEIQEDDLEEIPENEN